MRIVIPAMGPAPIALDFAVPIAKQNGDDTEVFSFYIGFLR
ncbi:MAG: BamA/TamA family outer membrane protein [Planctomycetota bacterium]